MKRNRIYLTSASLTPKQRVHTHVVAHEICGTAGGPEEPHTHPISADGSELEEWLGHKHTIPQDVDKE